jgi:transposase
MEDVIMSRVITSNTAQLVLLPSDAGAWLPEKHLARFIDQTVERLDLSKIIASYDFQEKRGRPAYDPTMLTKLVIYGYCTGITSNRGIEQATIERIGFRFLAGHRLPDHSVIAKFKKNHLPALANLFKQVLDIAAEAGLIELKKTAVDGTKVLADASKHKAMSYDRICKSIPLLKEETSKLKREKRKLPVNSSKRQELRKEIDFKKKRLNNIKQAKIVLEEKAKQDAQRERESADKKKRHKKSKPAPKAQYNFTDPDSRIMKVGNGFEQCYNAQVAVDHKAQIIIAQQVTQDGNDKMQLRPVLKAVAKSLGLLPDKSLADAGYYSEENITAPELAKIELLVPPNRQKHSDKPITMSGRKPQNLSVTDEMRRKLQTTEGKKLYAMRKAIVEPVFGQIKEANLCFRQFSFRGLRNVQNEWALVCLAHNLLKIFRSTIQSKQLCQLAA